MVEVDDDVVVVDMDVNDVDDNDCLPWENHSRKSNAMREAIFLKPILVPVINHQHYD